LQSISESSLILLKLKSKVLKPLKTAAKVDVGDKVVLVGGFYKSFPSIFQGIVSSASQDELILNAPVVPGSSGSAVVNEKGHLAAVVRGRVSISFGGNFSIRDHRGEITLKSDNSRNQNLCYAIPIARVKKISNHLRRFGRVKRGWLGVYMDDKGNSNQITITHVINGSPAYKAGIKSGDIIVAINGEKIATIDDVGQKVRVITPGKKIQVEIIRRNKTNRLNVEIGELLPQDLKKYSFNNFNAGTEFNSNFPRLQNYFYDIRESKKIGVIVQEISPELAIKFKVKEGHGLLISRVDKGSAADKVGLEVGDIIVRANRQDIKSNDNIRSLLNSLKTDEKLNLEIYRNGRLKKFDITPTKITRTNYDYALEQFTDKLKSFSFQLFPGDTDINRFREQIGSLKSRINRLKTRPEMITEKRLDEIKRNFYQIKKVSDNHFKERLNQLEKVRSRIFSDQKRITEEFNFLKQSELKAIEDLFRKFQQKKSKRDPVKQTI